MQLLLRREQTATKLTKVSFKLWGKIELDEEEQALSDRYNLADAVLIGSLQSGHKRNSIVLGLLVSILVGAGINTVLGATFAVLGGVIAGAAFGYWFFHHKRETIYMKDMLHGRHFSCPSIVDLAKQEDWLTGQITILRQVLESAKHWDGTETVPIKALPKEEAKALMLAAA